MCPTRGLGLPAARARAARRGPRRAPDARPDVVDVHVAADGDARLVLAADAEGLAADHRQAVAAPGQRRVAALLELVPPRRVFAGARFMVGVGVDGTGAATHAAMWRLIADRQMCRYVPCKVYARRAQAILVKL